MGLPVIITFKMKASLVLLVALGFIATALAGTSPLAHRNHGNNKNGPYTDEELVEFFDILEKIEKEDSDKPQNEVKSSPSVSTQQHNRLVRWLNKQTRQFVYNGEDMKQLHLFPEKKNGTSA